MVPCALCSRKDIYALIRKCKINISFIILIIIIEYRNFLKSVILDVYIKN